MRRLSILLLLITLTSIPTFSRQSTPAASPKFAPFEQWRQAVLAGDASTLSSLYSQNPQPQIFGTANAPIPYQDDLNFWSGWKTQGLVDISAQIIKEDDPRPNVHVLILQLTLTVRNGAPPKKSYVSMIQTWFHHGDQWVIGICQRSPAARLRQPMTNQNIYPSDADARKDISKAVTAAAPSHKRVILVFGGNWCFDCHVLDEAFHSPEIAPTLNKSFLVVHVDIGRNDKNLEVAEKYGVPLDRGVPALAVLDSTGKLIFSQKRGEFEAARSMAPEDILAFLNKWKPAPSAARAFAN